MNRNRPMRNIRFASLAVFLFITLAASCDMGSYNPIARALDPFEPMGTNSDAWMNVEGSVGSSSTRVLILQEGMPSNGQIGGYAYIEISDNLFPSPNTEIVLVRGTYEVSGTATGAITLYPFAEYRGTYRQTGSPSNNPPVLDRQGEVLQIPFSRNSGNLDLGSPALGFKAIKGSGGVLQDIMNETTPSGLVSDDVQAAQFLLVYQIGVYASQVIVPGFGGPGMMTYYKNQTPFNGLVGGNESILMSSALPTARVDFDYYSMENLPGLSMSGLLRTDSDARGDGDMSQTVETHIDDGVISDGYDLSVSYDQINITGTIPSSGQYPVSVDGTPSNVSYQALLPGQLNFPGIL